MYSNSKRYLIIFNGEIYNHLEIRSLINKKIKIFWKSNSDTETLINFIENFDMDYVLKKISGMFAFVVYDFKDDKLYLARDIAGEKPLYITANEEYLAFSSDLKPFKNLNFYKKDINKIALKSYLKYNYVPAPITIFENTFKINSAH